MKSSISFCAIMGLLFIFTAHQFARHDVIDSECNNVQALHVIAIIDDDAEMVDDEVMYIPISSDTTCENEIFRVLLNGPKYEGGEAALKKYLRVNSSKISGKVYLKFVVDCKGIVTDPKIIEGLSPWADSVALNLVKSMAKWSPGEFYGKKVNTELKHHVTFRK
jgi:hypothetical protein